MMYFYLTKRQFETLVGLPAEAFDLEKWEYSTLQEGGEENDNVL